MKLHWSPRSPFVRKVMIVAHERGLIDRLNCVRTVAAMTTPHAELMRDNPLSKIPTLVLDDGTVLYDSPVICEYLDALDRQPQLFPIEREARMRALRRQALGDGYLDLLVLARNEGLREQPSGIHLKSAAEREARPCPTISSARPTRWRPLRLTSVTSRSAARCPISISALPKRQGSSRSCHVARRLRGAALGRSDASSR